MAFMYPVHYPAVPFRWDEPAWTSKTSSPGEEAELDAMEKRVKSKSMSAEMQSIAAQLLSTSMHEDDDIIGDLDEDIDEEDEIQNSR